MRINTNVIALSVRTQLLKTDSAISKASLMMSSGLKINSAKDDAAGLAIGNKLDRQVRGYEKVSNNTSDGISLIQTLDGALSSVNEMLEEMRTLAVQSSNGTLEDSDRRKIQTEIEELKEEISDLSKRTEFNGIKLLDGDGARLTYDKTGSATKLSKVNYVSGNVPQGQLEFTIDSLGSSASVAFSEASISAGTEGTLTINGSTLTFTGDESKEEILESIKQACEDNNLDIDLSTGTVTSRIIGSEATINITSNPASFGFASSVSSTGTDAVVSGITLNDLETGAGINSFNSGISSTTYVEGNRVYINSTNGQKIEVDLTGNGTGAQKIEIRNEGQIKIQVGTQMDMEIDLYVRNIDTDSLGIEYINLSTQSGAADAITKIDEAVSKVLDQRTYLGAAQNRLAFTETAIDTAALNTEEAYSRVMDVDMAKAMTDLSAENVKSQAALAILTQANQRPQQILQLLG
ncbi:MAG: flagellin [Lachnospirales bacterium]